MARTHTKIINKVANDSNLIFYRQQSQSILSGVCAGIASAIGQPIWVVRSAFLILLLLTGIVPMSIFYLLLSIVLEKQPVSWETDNSMYEVGIDQIRQLEMQLNAFDRRTTDLEYFMLSDDFNAHIFD